MHRTVQNSLNKVGRAFVRRVSLSVRYGGERFFRIALEKVFVSPQPSMHVVRHRPVQSFSYQTVTIKGQARVSRLSSSASPFTSSSIFCTNVLSALSAFSARHNEELCAIVTIIDKWACVLNIPVRDVLDPSSIFECFPDFPPFCDSPLPL